MTKSIEPHAIYLVEFSHWLSKGETRKKLHLHAEMDKTYEFIESWINKCFSRDDGIDNPIIWQIKFVGYSFSLDHHIDEQDF